MENKSYGLFGSRIGKEEEDFMREVGALCEKYKSAGCVVMVFAREPKPGEPMIPLTLTAIGDEIILDWFLHTQEHRLQEYWVNVLKGKMLPKRLKKYKMPCAPSDLPHPQEQVILLLENGETKTGYVTTEGAKSWGGRELESPVTGFSRSEVFYGGKWIFLNELPGDVLDAEKAKQRDLADYTMGDRTKRYSPYRWSRKK